MWNSFTQKIAFFSQVLFILFGLFGIFLLVSGHLPSFLADTLRTTSPYGSFTSKDLQLATKFLALLLMLVGILSTLSLVFPARFLSFIGQISNWIETKTDRKESNLSVAVFLVILTFCVYFTSFFIGFYSDDYTWLVVSENTRHDFSQIFSLIQSHFFRPAAHIYHFINYLFCRENPHFYHLIPLLLHGFSSFYLYLIIRKLTLDKKLSLLSAVLFCIYPVSNRAVMWISTGGTVFAGFIYLVAFYLFLSYIKNNKFGAFFLSVCFFIIGIFTHEAVIGLVPVFIILAFLFGNKKEIQASLLFLIICVIYLGFQFVLQSSGFVVTENIYRLDLALIIKNFGKYTFTAFVPQGHRVLYYFPSINLLVIILSSITVVFVLLKGTSFLRLAIVWYVCLVSPILPFNLPVQPRYLYLCSFAVCVLLSWFFLFIYRKLSPISQNTKIAAHILLTVMIAVNIMFINIASLRMKNESEIMKKYVESIKNNPQKMKEIKKGHLPKDSPLNYDHLKSALKLK